jgi:hypothetical protein
MTETVQVTTLQQVEDVVRNEWVRWFKSETVAEAVPALSVSLHVLRETASSIVATVDVLPFIMANQEVLTLKTWSFNGENVEETIRLALTEYARAKVENTLKVAIKAKNERRLLSRIDNTVTRATHIILANGHERRTQRAREAQDALTTFQASTFSIQNLNSVLVHMATLRNDLGATLMQNMVIADEMKKEIIYVRSEINDLIELRGIDYIWFQNSLQECLKHLA